MAADFAAAQEHLLDPEVMFPFNAHKAIVIHKTAGDATPADVFATFKASAQLPQTNSNWGRSSHYAIGQDGSIWQFVPEEKGAGANGIPGPNMDPFWKPFLQEFGNLNRCTISIEHCDPSTDNNTPLTPAQKEASFNLVAHLARKYGIPASHIKPHRSIAATSCPGNYPMDELIHFVETGGESEMLEITDVSSFFTAVSDISWKCNNGHLVIGGILHFFRRIPSPLAVIGLPRTNEINVTGHPGVKIQVFERIVLCFDPSHTLDRPPGSGDVYAMHIDNPGSPAVAQLLNLLNISPAT